ncbi:MAG TPA: ABC transporter ATP-binding protein [Candidatus Pullilachnospira intestinigallinarum]|nr:ABC transporter ATP-binding protein [Candidatus Pullilachnospira intestinigallinarum]
MIEVNNLVKKYGDHLAVDHLSFHVDKGQIYGFLGPNGAGKSTTMNIMTGYIASTEGEVIINGHNILEEPEEAKKCIGYLPEQPPLYFDMTVKEYLKFAAELKKIPKDRRENQIKDVMKMVGITSMQDRLIKNLSKGYRQRVGLAQAILGYPEIIILDEPTVGLDPKQIIEIRELIRKLAKNHTIILSSHILSEVSEVCDYILIINHGKLVASDTTDNLEKMAKGSNTLELSVKGDRERLKNILDQMEEIRDIEWTKSEEQGIVSLKITTDENTDIREKIFYKMAEKQMPIMDMHSTRISLEDIFLELTDNAKKPDSSKKRKLRFTWDKKEQEAVSEDEASEEISISQEAIQDTEKAADTENKAPAQEADTAGHGQEGGNDDSNL